MGAYKKFDKELFEAYDLKARDSTKKYLRGIGCKVADNPDIYAQDLIAELCGESLLVECEIKAVWKGNKFPFDSVQLPERKKKFFTDNTVFFIWNESGTKAARFWAKHLKGLLPVEVNNKMVRNGEKFYQVPLSVVKFVEIYV